MGQKVSKEVAKRSAVADPLTGFFRGAIRTPQEEAQGAFLRGTGDVVAGAPGKENDAGGGQHQDEEGRGTQQATSSTMRTKPSEMPPELIKFMTDVGPLRTSDDGSMNMMKRKTRPMDSSRKTENMRLAEQIEGYETARTSSFSSKRDLVDENDFGLDVIQMFGLLSSKGSSLSLVVESPAIAAAAESSSSTTTTTAALISSPWMTIPAQHTTRVEHALASIQLPVLLQDPADNAYIGVASDRINDAPELQALTPLPKTRVKLVLEDLWEIDNHKKNDDDDTSPALETSSKQEC